MSPKLSNTPPGEVLSEEFLKSLGVSQSTIARAIGVSPRRINEIVLGKCTLTLDTALCLASYPGISERFWLGRKTDFDREEVRRRSEGRSRRRSAPANSRPEEHS